jgi:hypothetical protein
LAGPKFSLFRTNVGTKDDSREDEQHPLASAAETAFYEMTKVALFPERVNQKNFPID